MSLTVNLQIRRMQTVAHDDFSNRQMLLCQIYGINLECLWYEYLAANCPHKCDTHYFCCATCCQITCCFCLRCGCCFSQLLLLSAAAVICFSQIGIIDIRYCSIPPLQVTNSFDTLIFASHKIGSKN